MYRKHLRMARGEGEVESRQGETHIIKSHFVERFSKLPVFNVAWNYAANTYSTIKESNRLVNFTLTNAERSVNFVADQAKPVVLRFEKQIQVADDFAFKSLGTLEEKVPIITKRPDQIIGDTRKLYTDAVHDKIEGLRRYGSSTVKRISDYGYQTASMFLGESVVNSMVSSVDGVLVMTETYVDRILPPGDDERKEHRENNCDHQNNVNKEVPLSADHPTVTRLARIASIVHHRVLRITVIKINYARTTVMEVFNLPDHVMAFAFQNVEKGSIFLQRLWDVLNNEKSIDIHDEQVPLKRLLPVLRPILKQLLSLHQRLTSSTKNQNYHESSNNIGNNLGNGQPEVETLVHSIFQMFGLLRAVPALAPIYIFSLLSWFSKKVETEEESSEVMNSIESNNISKIPEQNNVHFEDNDN